MQARPALAIKVFSPRTKGLVSPKIGGTVLVWRTRGAVLGDFAPYMETKDHRFRRELGRARTFSYFISGFFGLNLPSDQRSFAD